MPRMPQPFPRPCAIKAELRTTGGREGGAEPPAQHSMGGGIDCQQAQLGLSFCRRAELKPLPQDGRCVEERKVTHRLWGCGVCL